MTQVGAGGVVIKRWGKSQRFIKEYSKLSAEMRNRVDAKLRDLAADPRPPGLRFEKLKGYKPARYTVHVTGNYKISLEINGSDAWLRRVADHDTIDRAP